MLEKKIENIFLKQHSSFENLAVLIK